MNNPLDNLWFLVAGYGITFVAILAYLLHLRRREKDIERDA